MRRGWTEKSIDELAFVGRGKSRHRPRNDPSLYGGEHPFVQTAEIHNADLWITSFKQTYSDNGLAQSKMWDPGTICITNAGENTGDCAVLGIRACFPDSIIAVIADESKSDTVFLKYAVDQLKPRLRRITRGATQDNLSVAKLTAFKFPTPPLEEQRRIGAVVRAYGDLIENNRRRIQLLEQAARLLYKEWFVHLRFPGHEHVTITDGVPDGWEKKTIGELAPFQYGKALKKDDRIPGLFPVYGSSGIVGSHEKALVTGPAIIVGRKGNVGSVYWSKDDFHPIDTVYFIEPEHCTIHLYYSLLSMQFINTDVAVPGLNRDFAHSRKLLIPDDTILTLFEQDVAVMHDQIDHLTKYKEALIRARDLLLPRIMNGEVAV